MQLIGLARLGRDAEARTVGDNVVANLSLAFDYYDPKAEKKRSTTWVDAALWGKQATTLEQYLVKGRMVCATVDDLHIEQYEGRNGTGHKLVGRVTSIKLAGGGEQQDRPTQQRQDVPPGTAQRQARAAAPAPRPAPDLDDEDIPF